MKPKWQEDITTPDIWWATLEHYQVQICNLAQMFIPREPERVEKRYQAKRAIILRSMA